MMQHRRTNKPYLFRYWQEPTSGTPEYINLCLETLKRNATEFELVLLDWESCIHWVEERDLFWEMSRPLTQGRSTSIECRRIATFTDLLRIALIAKYGGLWIDADTLILPGINVLSAAIQRYDFIGYHYATNNITNNVLAGCKGSNFFNELQYEIKRQSYLPSPAVSWGYYGFRLLAKCIAVANIERSLLLPWGICNQLQDQAQVDFFAEDEQLPLPSSAVTVSLHNSSMDSVSRRLSRDTLISRSCIFSNVYTAAMSEDSTLNLDELIALNQSSLLLPEFIKRNALNSKIQRLIKREGEQVKKLKTCHAQISNIKSRLNQEHLRAKTFKTSLMKQRARTLALLSDMYKRGLVSRKDLFNEIYRDSLWGCEETPSGKSATIQNTSTLRQTLPILLKTHGINSLLDIPCGDFHWMQHVELNKVKYIGADIVPELIEQNKVFQSNLREFIELDITESKLPAVDCIFVRDCFSFLPYKDILSAIRNILKTKATYLLMTNFEQHKVNKDAETMNLRYLNFHKAPFFFPEPISKFSEKHPKHLDKTLSLWKIADLKFPWLELAHSNKDEEVPA